MREETTNAIVFAACVAAMAIVSATTVGDAQALPRGFAIISGIFGYWALLKWTVWRKVVPP